MPATSHRTRFAIALLVSTATAPVLEAQYVPIRNLDPAGSYSSAGPVRVRDGVAAGSGRRGNATYGLVWNAAGIQELGMPSGRDYAVAQDVRSNGDAVGWATSVAFGGLMPVIWQAGAPTDLNTLRTGGSRNHMHSCYGIDRHGRICGGMNTSPGKGHGFLFDHGFVTDLMALPGGGDTSIALAMNDHLEMVGGSSAATGLHAVLFDATGIHDLHDPLQITGPDSQALDVDRFTRVCGFAEYAVSTGGTRTSAVLWDHGVVTDLGATLAGTSQANGINDFGDVVGFNVDPTLGQRALLFGGGAAIPIDTLIDPALGWTLLTATGIDNEGRIVGAGSVNGIAAPWILEPACLGSFTPYGSGCAGSNGLEPILAGTGCPGSDRDFALEVRDGPSGAAGFLFAGTGTNTIQVRPGCDLQVVPLLIAPVPAALDGIGELWIAQHLPAGTPIFDVNLQALFFDPGAAYGISATRPLALHFE
jgi:uncharacterized membrane protein